MLGDPTKIASAPPVKVAGVGVAPAPSCVVLVLFVELLDLGGGVKPPTGAQSL